MRRLLLDESRDYNPGIRIRRDRSQKKPTERCTLLNVAQKMSSDLELNDAPTDGITRVAFSATVPNLLLVSSWDSVRILNARTYTTQHVRLYDVQSNHLRGAFAHDAAVLDCVMVDDARSFSCGLDGTVQLYDWSAGSRTVLGRHTSPVKSVVYNDSKALVVSGGWDAALKTWDARSPDAAALGSFDLPAKVYSMSTAREMLCVAMGNRHVWVYDVRNMKEPFQRRESALKYQTRAIACFPSAEGVFFIFPLLSGQSSFIVALWQKLTQTGFAISSIEGRVAVEYFDASAEAQAKKYAFKCHRQSMDGVDTVYPVHALAFHPVYVSFV
jgi:cell cycle arrest protein BUB3